MSEIQNPKQKNNRVESVCNLRFIWNLVLGICDFRHQTPRQSRKTLTWPKEPGFSGQNKK
jgi:hypothetical protein